MSTIVQSENGITEFGCHSKLHALFDALDSFSECVMIVFGGPKFCHRSSGYGRSSLGQAVVV